MQVLGSVNIKVNGQMLRSNPGAKLELGGPMREAVLGTKVVHGYHEKVQEAKLECEITLARGDSLDDIRNITDATLIFEADSGQSWSIANAFLTEPPVVNEGEGGKVALKFSGDPAEQI
jgi:hypothetical protein